jgi:ABC-type cobalamin/Fe3+-siderophores transport system ATPase subunit
MKLFLSSIYFYNRAPFDTLKLDFEENEIAVLTAVNGRGKTTIISHIVDAFHEMARPFYLDEYEGRENKFYRVSSPIECLDFSKTSIAYLRFKTTEGEFYDYINIRGQLNTEHYESYDLPPNKIPFHDLVFSIDSVNYAKKISTNLDQKKAHELFESNLLTYFPSYRFEAPGYLNDTYQIKLNFINSPGFSGKLKSPIEVVSGLPQLINWVMDIVLDLSVDQTPHTNLVFNNLNTILTKTLISKNLGALRFGIGPRNFGGARIQVMSQNGNQSIYPSIFNISSGESSILCLFGELIRQADNNANNIGLEKVSGIVLIDEVDKHLHIKLQKEVLPSLFNLFPNVQFIVSSHSPFLSMGLADVALSRTKIIDLDNFGITKDPTTNELYSEVYRMMIGENDRFKEMYHSLEATISKGTLPLVITEGKTDIQHLKVAREKSGNKDLDLEFFDVGNDWGDSKLKLLLEQISKLPQARMIIGIFDRDAPTIVSEIEKDEEAFKKYGNNVFAFCIPTPIERSKYKNISIEFFYRDCDLKTKAQGKCLYFDNEVEIRQHAATKKIIGISKLNIPIQEGEETKKIYDNNVGDLDWIHSKAVFANLVETNSDFTKDFDFTSFTLIFDKLRQIINQEANGI